MARRTKYLGLAAPQMFLETLTTLSPLEELVAPRDCALDFIAWQMALTKFCSVPRQGEYIPQITCEFPGAILGPYHLHVQSERKGLHTIL